LTVNGGSHLRTLLAITSFSFLSPKTELCSFGFVAGAVLCSLFGSVASFCDLVDISHSHLLVLSQNQQGTPSPMMQLLFLSTKFKSVECWCNGRSYWQRRGEKGSACGSLVANKAELDGVYKSVMLSSINSGFSQRVNSNSSSYFVIDYNDSTACYRGVNTDCMLVFSLVCQSQHMLMKEECYGNDACTWLTWVLRYKQCVCI
jgi:hypothetical protein